MTTENLGNLTLRVNGPDIDTYASTDFSLENIPYDGAVSIHFVTKINFNLSAELIDDRSPYAIIVHNPGEDIFTRLVDSFDVKVPSDGYYEIVTLVLPTTTYIEYGLGFTPGSNVGAYANTNIVAVDITEGPMTFKILEHTVDETAGYGAYIWSGWKEICLHELLLLLELIEKDGRVNPKELTVKKYTKSAFVMDNLYKCYISKANDLLNIYSSDSGFCSGGSLCRDLLDKHKTDIQIRDYLWMAINVIKYCVQNCQYLKALKILNCVTTCAGICSDIKITESNTKIPRGCGCGKRT